MNTDDTLKVSSDSLSSGCVSSECHTEPSGSVSDVTIDSGVALAEAPSVHRSDSLHSEAHNGSAGDAAVVNGTNGTNGTLTAKPPARPRPSKSARAESALAALLNGSHVPVSPTRPKKLRNLNAEESFELLVQARTADSVQLFLRDGRVIDGAILFNEIKGTGRIINVVKEISVDFRAIEVRDIRF